MSENPATLDEMLQIKEKFRSRFGMQPAGYEMSRATVDALTEDLWLNPSGHAPTCFFGIPVIFDESVPLGQFRIVPAKT